MKEEVYKLFEYASIEEIVDYLHKELQTRNESPFWADKVVPFTTAILSVLKPLQKNGILFDPQGMYQEKITPELFLEWNDFVSLKTLAFTLQKSNQEKILLRTKLEDSKCNSYEEINLDILGSYLTKYSVNLEYENLDFPISSYNLHQGVSNVIRSLLK